MTSAQFLTDKIKKELQEHELIKRHNVRVICQDDAEILTLLDTELAQLNGLMCFIAIDRIDNQHPAHLIEWKLSVAEVVPINRQSTDCITALDLTLELCKSLDNSEQRLVNITHEVVETGIFQANATFKSLILTTRDK